jgi:predicted transcriptional regulator of viral defense system
VPVRLFNTARGELRVSTPEATAIDLAGYPEHAGGLDQVATILSELADEVDPAALEKAAASAPITWVQRLGYMLDLVDQEAAAGVIREYVQAHAREYAMLVPGRDQAGGHRAPQWKLVVNAALEPDI